MLLEKKIGLTGGHDDYRHVFSSEIKLLSWKIQNLHQP